MARKRTIPTHPAIVALRTEHAAFATWLAARGSEMGSCYDSDLGHDERAIAVKLSDRPFLWFVTAMATHMIAIPDSVDCYIMTQRSFGGSEIAVRAGYVIDCYGIGGFTDGTMRAYVWDGAALQRAGSVDHLHRVAQDVIRARAIAHLTAKRTAPTEWLAYMNSAARERELADIDRDIATARDW